MEKRKVYNLVLVHLGLEVTQLPRERWHPAGSGSPKSELAERPPEMAVIATA